MSYEITPEETDTEDSVSDGEWDAEDDALNTAALLSQDVIEDGITIDGETLTGSVTVAEYYPT